MYRGASGNGFDLKWINKLENILLPQNFDKKPISFDQPPKIFTWIKLCVCTFNLYIPCTAFAYKIPLLKCTVQRKLNGVVSYINREVFHSHWTACIIFFNLKETCSLNHKKTGFSGLSQNMWLIHFNGVPAANNWWQEANQLIAVIGLLLLN